VTTTAPTTAAPTRSARPVDGLPSMLAYLTRVLKTPTIGRCWEELADQARDETWSHEEYLAAVLQRQVAERESAGTTMRIRTAHFPAVKTIEDFNLDHLPSLRRDVLAHLATGTFVAKTDNVILLGPRSPSPSTVTSSPCRAPSASARSGRRPSAWRGLCPASSRCATT